MNGEKKIRVNLSELLYLSFIAIMLVAKGIGLYDGLLLYKVFLAIALCFLGVKMCITEYTIKEWIYMILIYLGCAIIYLNCKEKGVVICTLVVLNMKDVSLNRVLKVGLWTWGITMSSNVLYHIVNLDSSGYKVHEKLGIGHIFRWDLGFSHPNVLHISYLVLVIFIVYNLSEKYNWKHMLFLMAGNLFIFLYSVSYTGSMVVTLYLGIAWYVIVKKELRRGEYFILELIFPACLIVSFGTPLFLSGKMFNIVNKIFSNRLVLSKHYLVAENLKLLGNNLEKITTSMYTLDNSFLFACIVYGILAFVVIVCCYFIFIHYLIKKKKNEELAIVVCLLIAGITEPFLFNTSFKNVSLFFIGNFIWQNSRERNSEIKKWTIFPKLQHEFQWNATKCCFLKSTIACVWKKKRKRLMFISLVASMILGFAWGLSREMPKGYIMPRVHVDIVEKEKQLWCIENPNEPQYKGIKILDYVDEKTYMQFFDGNIIKMEQIRLCVSGTCISWISILGIYMAGAVYQEQRRVKWENIRKSTEL